MSSVVTGVGVNLGKDVGPLTNEGLDLTSTTLALTGTSVAKIMFSMDVRSDL